MKNAIIGMGALALAALPLAGLSGCTSQAETIGWATICGVATDLKGSTAVLNAKAAAALAAIEVPCANPPTTAAAISSDLVQDFLILEPVVVSMLNSNSATALKMTALIDQLPDGTIDQWSASPKLKAAVVRIQAASEAVHAHR